MTIVATSVGTRLARWTPARIRRHECASTIRVNRSMFRLKPVKLEDCEAHGEGSGAELLIVAGDSASKSVAAVRDLRTQAVLPMQGKPMNAIKASPDAVASNELFRVLVTALGCGWRDTFRIEKLQYERIIFLFDPDADGIHCGALMLMFFHQWLPQLLSSGRLPAVHPPAFEIHSEVSERVIYAFDERHYALLKRKLDEGQVPCRGRRIRGLASLSETTLLETCVAPASRNINPLGPRDADAAIRVFLPIRTERG